MIELPELSRVEPRGDGPFGLLLFLPPSGDRGLPQRLAAHGKLRAAYRIELPVVGEPRYPVQWLSILEFRDRAAWDAAMRTAGSVDARGLVVTPWKPAVRALLPITLKLRALAGIDESVGAPPESLPSSPHNPTLERFREFAYPRPAFGGSVEFAADDRGPPVMLNLLKYARTATVNGETLSGKRAYLRYGRVAIAHVASLGGTIEWMGDPPRGSDWDSVALVRYPSRQHFVRMVSRAHYQAALPYRDAALESTALWAMSRR